MDFKVETMRRTGNDSTHYATLHGDDGGSVAARGAGVQGDLLPCDSPLTMRTPPAGGGLSGVKNRHARELEALADELGHVEAARLCGVHRTTFGRWLHGRSRPPEAVLSLLRLHVADMLPNAGADWCGWRFAGGVLYSPAGDAFRPGDLLAQRYERAAVAAYQRECARLQAQIARLVRLNESGAANDPAAVTSGGA